MEFRITEEDMEPSELRYLKVMQPLWNRLEDRLDELADLDWEMRNTRGPTNLIANAELTSPRVDWIEIRGEEVERVDQLEGEDEILVRTSKWFGVAMTSDGSGPDAGSEFHRTEAKESLEAAFDGLVELLDDLGIDLEQ